MRLLSRPLAPFLLLCTLAMTGGCATATPPSAAELSLEALKNLAYTGVIEDEGTVQLAGGHWKGAPLDPGSATAPTVDFADDFVARGDVDGDGNEEAVVVLHSWTGGSGVFAYLAVVSGSSGEPRNVATGLLGDRVQVRDVRVEDGRILVEMRAQGPDDPSCCPGMHMRQTWRWHAGSLEELAGERTSARTSVSELEGSHWELARWSAEEPADRVPVVSLAYSQGRFSGNAGCNRFSALAQDGASAGLLVVGQGMATRMACEESRMATENRFLRILPGVRAFRYSPGMLMLAYTREDGGSAELWFRASTAP